MAEISETTQKPALNGKSRIKGRFVKGQSGNPGGRPKLGLPLREYVRRKFDADPDGCVEYLFRERPDLFFAYGFGKPADKLELSGPDGSPIQWEKVSDDTLRTALESLSRANRTRSDAPSLPDLAN